jgi:hypothetical protein
LGLDTNETTNDGFGASVIAPRALRERRYAPPAPAACEYPGDIARRGPPPVQAPPGGREYCPIVHDRPRFDADSLK